MHNQETMLVLFVSVLGRDLIVRSKPPAVPSPTAQPSTSSSSSPLRFVDAAGALCGTGLQKQAFSNSKQRST
jgi:hypothetical protein